MTRTWRFDFNLQMAVFSLHEEVSDLFKQILDTANDRIHFRGLKKLSFFYDLPEDGIAKISGYLHVDKKSQLPESAVRTWIVDDRIKGDVQWTPIHPGKNGDWKQEPLISGILAACDGGTRRLEDWVGSSSDKIDRGGRPSAAGSGGGAPPRGRPPRPPLVATDSPVQAAVRNTPQNLFHCFEAEPCTRILPRPSHLDPN